jgi:dUTP pyrophosphatase
MSVDVATVRLQVQLLHPDARPPLRTRPGDAGYDLCCLHAFELPPGEAAKVPTGLALAIPPGVAGLVVPRSGLAAKFG